MMAICPCGADYNFTCRCSREEIEAYKLTRIKERYGLTSPESLEHWAQEMGRDNPGSKGEAAWLILRLEEFLKSPEGRPTHLDLLAYTLYQTSQSPPYVRWWCMDEDLKRKWRYKATQIYEQWADGEERAEGANECPVAG